MSGGYMGKLLWVDLSTGTIKEQALEERMCHDMGLDQGYCTAVRNRVLIH